MLWVNGCHGIVFKVRNLRNDEYGGRQEALTEFVGCGRLRSSHFQTTTFKIFQSCTLMRPSSARCDLTRSFLCSPTIFNTCLSCCRHSLIGADDRNRAQSTLRASLGCDVFQNSSRYPRRHNNLSWTLTSHLQYHPPLAADRLHKHPGMHSTRPFPVTSPPDTALFDAQVEGLPAADAPCKNSCPSSAPAVLPSSSPLSMFS